MKLCCSFIYLFLHFCIYFFNTPASEERQVCAARLSHWKPLVVVFTLLILTDWVNSAVTGSMTKRYVRWQCVLWAKWSICWIKIITFSMNREISITAPAARRVCRSSVGLKAWLQSNYSFSNNVPRHQYQKSTIPPFSRNAAPPALSLIWHGGVARRHKA